MKFHIEQHVIDDALKTVQFALLTRASLPILNNVHINAAKNGVSFTLTDQEITIMCNAAADVTSTGQTTLPMRRLLSIIRRLPNQPIQFALDEDEFIQISCRNICFKIHGVKTTEFPKTLTESYENCITLPKKIINRLIIDTSFATAIETSKPIISGPLLQVKPDLFTCVATDGKRLAVESEAILSTFSGSCVIPPKATSALIKLMAGPGDVTFCFGVKSVQFEFSNEYDQATIINSKLIEGRFPSYDAIIPREQDYNALIDREKLVECLKRIALILSDKAQGVRLTFTENFLKMHAVTENDESYEEMQVQYRGSEQTITFNPTYLIDPLKRLQEDTVTLGFTNSQKAVSLRSGHSFTYVLMPMRMS